jgi:hypothetical protein
LHDEKELIYQKELVLKNKALEMKDDQSNASVDSNKSMNSKGDIGARDRKTIVGSEQIQRLVHDHYELDSAK